MATAELHARAREIEAVVRSLVGVRFVPQGRDELGVDCLGVVLVAAREIGIDLAGLEAFPLRGIPLAEAERGLLSWGCRALASGELRPGDVLIAEPALCQVHFAVLTSVGVVEAHAGLRRVVERPIGKAERWASGWRLPAEEG